MTLLQDPPELANDYVEEHNVGLSLSNFPGIFHSSNKFVFFISSNSVVVFNTRSGKRENIFTYSSEPLVAVSVIGDSCFAVAGNGVLIEWNVDTQSLVGTKTFSLDKIAFAYPNNDGFYCVSQINETSNIFKLLVNSNDEANSYKLMGTIKKSISNAKHFAITDYFAVVITARVKLEVFPFDNFVLKDSKYVCRGWFPNMQKQSLLEFNEVKFVDGTLYASLNIGRIYFWKKFGQFGFSSSNINHFHRNASAASFAIGPKGALYCGGGESRVQKWNLAITGGSRWGKATDVERFDAPVNALTLSPDGALLGVQLEDNTIWVVQTTSMTILSELQTLQWHSKFNWLRLKHDPIRPDLVLTGGRIGHIQWFDPTKWRTVASFDVTEEETPPRDNVPYGLSYCWLNVYEVNASPSTLVTVEKRRNRHNEQSFIKFFRRNPKSALSELQLEDTIEFDKEVVHILSSHDDLSTDEAFATLTEEEIVIIDVTGQITVFTRDVERSGRWLMDFSRSARWVGSVITRTSSIRNNCFAAVHSTCKSTHGSLVLIWNLINLSIYETIDAVGAVINVEWAPVDDFKNVLLVSTSKCITAYDVVSKNVLWTINVPGFRVFCSKDICMCYNKHTVYIIDPLTGDVKSKVSFRHPQNQVVASVFGSNIRFVGKSREEGLALLKMDTKENQINGEIVSNTKKTPFADLLEQARERDGAVRKVRTMKNPSVMKMLEGAVYSIAPLTRIGPDFIKSCLVDREPDE